MQPALRVHGVTMHGRRHVPLLLATCLWLLGAATALERIVERSGANTPVVASAGVESIVDVAADCRVWLCGCVCGCGSACGVRVCERLWVLAHRGFPVAQLFRLPTTPVTACSRRKHMCRRPWSRNTHYCLASALLLSDNTRRAARYRLGMRCTMRWTCLHC